MLLQVTSFELRQRRLDFTSSGQGFFDATGLFVNDVELVNALELLQFDDDKVQLIVCEECGLTQCQPGSWASLRAIEDGVVLIPAFSAIQAGEREAPEFAPPRYMAREGIPTFPSDTYEELRRKTGKFPVSDQLRACTSLEVLNLLQFTAPGRVLGVFGSAVEIQSGQIIAVTEGDLDHELETLNKLIVRVQNGDGDLHSGHLDRLVEFHVDIAGFPTWHPFGYGPAGPLLNLRGIAD